MTTTGTHNRGLLLTLASFIIVVAGMRAAQSLLVPFLLAIFIAIICAGPMHWLQRHRVPSGLAVFLVILTVVGCSLTVLILVGSSVNDFTQSLPEYQQSLRSQALALVTWLQGLGIKISTSLITDYFDPGKALEIAGNMLARTSGVLANTFMILLTVIFILLEAAGMPAKLRAGLDNAETSLQSFERFNTGVQQYLAIKTLISFATGIIISLWLMFLGLDYPLLWGLVAFLLNYVPNIGSIIAAVPAVLLAVVQLGPGSSLMVAAGYLGVNLVLGSALEPKLMGRKLGISTLVVFLSLVFWGWVLGPVGMLLSVPLTMIVKIALEVKPETRWLALLLGSEIPQDVTEKG
ncbi:AI-2E family transporter [Geopsychrobacter electrodiphilus]|uniref:AI-2E family transporter n=1 Tax=Geopsychrobacter electrodiphilus TaxID=225196 RepID=UPI00037D1ED6|nr:AI-2E family transporter [Geopsychrobacter electrodiphilus]